MHAARKRRLSGAWKLGDQAGCGRTARMSLACGTTNPAGAWCEYGRRGRTRSLRILRIPKAGPCRPRPSLPTCRPPPPSVRRQSCGSSRSPMPHRPTTAILTALDARRRTRPGRGRVVPASPGALRDRTGVRAAGPVRHGRRRTSGLLPRGRHLRLRERHPLLGERHLRPQRP